MRGALFLVKYINDVAIRSSIFFGRMVGRPAEGLNGRQMSFEVVGRLEVVLRIYALCALWRVDFEILYLSERFCHVVLVVNCSNIASHSGSRLCALSILKASGIGEGSTAGGMLVVWGQCNGLRPKGFSKYGIARARDCVPVVLKDSLYKQSGHV